MSSVTSSVKRHGVHSSEFAVPSKNSPYNCVSAVVPAPNRKEIFSEPDEAFTKQDILNFLPRSPLSNGTFLNIFLNAMPAFASAILLILSEFLPVYTSSEVRVTPPAKVPIGV